MARPQTCIVKPCPPCPPKRATKKAAAPKPKKKATELTLSRGAVKLRGGKTWILFDKESNREWYFSARKPAEAFAEKWFRPSRPRLQGIRIFFGEPGADLVPS
jgi:hypothetical protein